MVEIIEVSACPISLDFHFSHSASRTIVVDLGMPIVAAAAASDNIRQQGLTTAEEVDERY